MEYLDHEDFSIKGNLKNFSDFLFFLRSLRLVRLVRSYYFSNFLKEKKEGGEEVMTGKIEGKKRRGGK